VTDDDLPTSIGRPALRALRAAGVDRLSEVARRREEELLALHGVGPKAVRLLRAELAERGLRLAGD
jgi:DNA-directed RNA polymerase alpha subunit